MAVDKCGTLLNLASNGSTDRERMALDMDLKRSAAMGRAELDRLVARLKTARRVPEAAATVDGWL